MGNVGNYIYSGFIPLVKTAMTILAGFTLTKKGLFPPAASRGASHLSMTIGLPCLLFASVVPAFNSDNIKFLGPLCLSAIVYQFSGLILGLIIREVFYVPADFRYGIIIASTFSNWGNLPTAVVQTIATQDPFDPKRDPTLGVAYVSVFMLIYSLSFFGLGTCKICAWDFRPRPEGEINVSRRVKWAERRAALAGIWRGMRETHHRPGWGGKKNRDPDVVQRNGSTEPEQEYEPDMDIEKQGINSDVEKGYSGTTTTAGNTLEPSLSRYRSHQEIIAEAYHDGISLAPVRSTVSHMTGNGPRNRLAGDANQKDREKDVIEEEREKRQLDAVVYDNTPEPHRQPLKKEDEGDDDEEDSTVTPRIPLWRRILTGVIGILNPVSISLFFALPIALISPLKALFVVVDNWTGTRIPNGPDGKPPLAFILDTAAFIGAICIPVGLMLLGASFARLKVPRSWGTLPIAAIMALMVSKMIIVPCIGVGMTQGLSQHTNLYPPDQKILKFVAMLLSGTPAAVNQLVITQIYSPDGSADTLSMFLIVQYVFMLVASAALAAVGLAFVN